MPSLFPQLVLLASPLPAPEVRQGGAAAPYDAWEQGFLYGAWFGWAGYLLLAGTLVAIWWLRRSSRARRRQWLRRAAAVFSSRRSHRWRELCREEGFKSAVGDLDEAIEHIEKHLAVERVMRVEIENDLEQAQRCFEAVPLPAIILDLDEFIIGANPAACRLFGRSEQRLAGVRLEHFLHDELDGDSPHSIRLVRDDGQSHDLDLHLGDVGGDGDGYRIGLLLDRRTDEPARERERSFGSQHAMEAMGEFAGSVAHDFNDQLTTILGHSYLMLGVAEGAPTDRAGIAEIAEAAEQARLLTQQLLAFSRRQASHPSIVDVVEQLRDMGSELQAMLGPHVTLELDAVCERALVRIDPVQFGVAIRDLVQNANDAMGAGGRLAIRVDHVTGLPADVRGPAIGDDEGIRWARIAVVDDGPGMDRDTLVRAFEPYFTTHPAGTRRGMGLPTVYGIVTQADGRISMANAAERGYDQRGVAVEIHLPLVTGGEPVEIKTSPTAGVSRARKRLLVVEDDAQVRRLIAFILNREGFDVITAEDGQSALDVCEERGGDLDLVLTDVNMPLVGGFELADELRRLYPGIKIVFMSGFIDSEGVPTESQFTTAFLQKPFTPQELLAHVQAGLESEGVDGDPSTRVLIVEDEDEVGNVLRALLEGLGYRCQLARDGAEALWKLKERVPDIVISDMVMPNKDGLQTCIEIQRQHPGLPIIAMSGQSSGAASLRAAELLGATATLQKPFSRDELVYALRQALELE